MTTLKKLALAASAYLLPLAAFASSIGGGDTTTVNTEVTDLPRLFIELNAIINTIIPFIVGLAVFIIIWGVFTYIAGAGDEEKRATAKSFIIWGVVGVFIMLSIWGLVNILVNSINLRKRPIETFPIFGTPEGVQPVTPSTGQLGR
ncbi:MAG: hypothetical protein UY62_C0083G0002 [Parcubacteria group bacterium GW2011_GWF2_50_9]|nr:MAG: hypothetical protein UY62_C0083G0002 [Parcubacteria group bacterium GW2011_GWF2_50_9]